MKIKGHIIATLTVSTIIFYVYNSFSAFISSLIGGIFIDIDHFLDYYLHRGMDFRMKDFFNWCYKNQWRKLILFLHSVELVFILWLTICIFNLGIFWIGLVVGISQHIILDILFNSETLNVFSYFFIYRVMNGFKREYIKRMN